MTARPTASGAGALRTAAGAMLDALAPRQCPGCDAWIPNFPAMDFCDRCRAALTRLAALTCCTRCARTLPSAALRDDACAHCAGEPVWNFAALARVGPYLPPLDTMVRGLKYAGRRDHAVALGRLLARSLQRRAWLAEVDCLLPVPMHPLRRWQRPSRHTVDLAEQVAHWIGVPVERRAVRRVRYAPSQTTLATRHARLGNVRGCFAAARGRPLAGRVVCIVDNMLVAGATIHEVAVAARRAGARRVYAAIVARSVLPADFQADPEALTRT